jgi:hypothetical protein
MALCVFVAVGLAAFSLAISGLGAIGNFVIFAAASVGLLLLTVNLTSVKARQPAAPLESNAGDPPSA